MCTLYELSVRSLCDVFRAFAKAMSDEKPAAVIFGATGNQGSSVLKHLYAGGSFEIFAVTRDVTNARSLQVSRAISLLHVTLLRRDKCLMSKSHLLEP